MRPPEPDPTAAATVSAACSAVATRIEETIRAAVPTGELLSLAYSPPGCTIDPDAYARCAAACEVDLTPGTLLLECEPGTVSVGSCGSTCSGECWLVASAACAGVCSGTCTGTCLADVSGGCTGECHGACDVWVSPPRCEVLARPPEVSAECHAACEAALVVDAGCTEAELLVNFGQLGGDVAARERLRTLVVALRAYYPDVLLAAVRSGVTVREAGGALLDALDAFADTLGTAPDAAACAVVALAVSVEVQATFSATAAAAAAIAGAVATAGGATP